MAAISSSEKPMPEREADQVGGRPEKLEARIVRKKEKMR